MLEIENLKKSFGTLEVLKGIDLSVTQGEVIAIIGKSGSGKSTMLRCINGLERFQQGRIHLRETALSFEPQVLREWRQRVGMVFQSFNLFPHLSAGKNVMLAPGLVQSLTAQENKARADALLSKVGLAEKFDAMPHQLSGGQQQRVAIARALAMQPDILLCDEITSALDPELVGEVLKVIEDLASQGMTILMVTHEMGFARRVANRLVFMHLGKVHEIGAAAQLFDSPKTPELQQFLSASMH